MRHYDNARLANEIACLVSSIDDLANAVKSLAESLGTDGNGHSGPVEAETEPREGQGMGEGVKDAEDAGKEDGHIIVRTPDGLDHVLPKRALEGYEDLFDDPAFMDEYAELYRRLWSQQEIDELNRLIELGVPLEDIAMGLRRSYRAVYKQAWKQGWRFNDGTPERKAS